MVRCGCNAASATTCDAIVLCVAANLGPGLRYDTVNGLLAVRLSGDAGNAASIGTDGGIYVPGGGTIPDPASGRKTIAGLPVRVAGASSTGGGSMTPFGSPDGLEYGIANRMDILNISTFALADGVAIARWEGPNSSLSNRTDNPSGIPTKYLSSVTLPSLLCDAGARDTPTGRDSGAPPALLSPDGGWFGFYANNYSPITLTDALHQVAARAVVYLAVYAGVAQDELERFIAGASRSVIDAGAQEWTLVGVPGYMDDGTGDMIVAPYTDWIADIVGAGMTPVLDMFDDASGGNVITPAEALASGAQWVRFAATPDGVSGTTYERIQDFIDVGLQVYVQVRSSRQFEIAQAYAMGARAVSSDNPVYSRGARGEAGDLDYRKTVVIPGLITRTMMEGALTHKTNTGSASEDIGWARQSAEGRNFSAMFGWEGGIGPHVNAQLLGELCPYVVTADYRLRLRFRVDSPTTPVPSGSVPKLGILFNCPTDRDPTWFGSDSPDYLNGYWFTIRVGSTNPGLVALGKFNNGDFSILDDSIQLPGINYGDWIYFNCRTTTTTVSLGIGHSSLGSDVSVSVNDTDHRGPYAFYGWEDDYTLPADNAGFPHGYSAYQNFATTSPMYEDLT